MGEPCAVRAAASSCQPWSLPPKSVQSTGSILQAASGNGLQGEDEGEMRQRILENQSPFTQNFMSSFVLSENKQHYEEKPFLFFCF